MTISGLVPDPTPPEPGEAPDPKEGLTSATEKQELPAVSEEITTSESSLPTPTDLQSPQVAPTAPQTSSTTTTPSSQTPEAIKEQQLTDALLARLFDITTPRNNFKCLFYGPPGGTKSSMLSLVSDHLIYDNDKGLIVAKTQHIYSKKQIGSNIQVLPYKSFQQAYLLLDRLEKHVPELEKYKVFSIDGFNKFSQQNLMNQMGRYAANSSSVNRWKPETDNYTENNNEVLDYIRRLADLDRDLIITSHSRTVDSKKAGMKIYPDFSEAVANKIEAMMDIVGYVEMIEEDGETFPVMTVKSNGVIHAKTRLPLPNVIKNPDWNELRKVWDKYIQENPT